MAPVSALSGILIFLRGSPLVEMPEMTALSVPLDPGTCRCEREQGH